jgi:eukaryotic-like serine/threonine-protein kinase
LPLAPAFPYAERSVTPQPPEFTTARIGDVIDGRFQIVKLIGRGTMADIFEAHDTMGGTAVALKIMHARLTGDSVARARFASEAKAQAMVRHPNVAALYESGISPAGYPYLILELLGGKSLARVLHDEGRLDPGRSARIIWQALQGLAATHALGILHRDIKPSNFVLEPAAGGVTRVVLIDFGFAALEGSPRLTREGFVVGSLSYLAPERLLGQSVDARSDLYGLGVVFYELVVGARPFVGDDDVVMDGHLERAPLAPSQAAPDAGISAGLDGVILRALAKDPAARPASAQAMAREIEAALKR